MSVYRGRTEVTAGAQNGAFDPHETLAAIACCKRWAAWAYPQDSLNGSLPRHDDATGEKSMATRTIGLALMLALLGVIGSAMPGHAMGICVGSRAMDIQQDACVKRATAVMRRHFKDVQPDCASIFAFGGGNLAAAIVCDQADK